MSNRLRTVLGEGFRVFFLAAGAFAVVAMAVWWVWLAADFAGAALPVDPFLHTPHLWHAHEMIFGYGSAVLGGFFLTAVPSWTGTPAARRTYLTIAAGTWFAGRIVVWCALLLPAWLVALVDLAFLPLLGVKLALQLARRPKPQNLMLLGVLALIWGGNLMVHLEWTGMIANGVSPGLHAGLLGIAATIAVIGGRVTPAFTRNAMLKAGIETGLPSTSAIVTAVAIPSALLLPVLIMAGAPDVVLGAFALVCGGAQVARIAGWRGSWTLDKPILWSLHLGFAMLSAGYVALGLSWLGLVNATAALHLLAIGAVGGMTLAVMSRATLGHTGRPLVAPGTVAYAFGFIALAAILRAIASWNGLGWYHATVLGSGALWLLAFVIFLRAFWTPLTTPRMRR